MFGKQVMKRVWLLAATVLLLVPVVVACAPQPTATLSPTATPLPAKTPTATPTQTPTPRPTDTPMPTPTPVPSLSGRVTDAATGQGIPGAKVEARSPGLAPYGWRHSATTAWDGSYAIFGLPAGEYVGRVTAPGYAREYYDNVVPSREARVIHITSHHETTGIDFDLTEGGSITGYVHQSDGITPIYRVEVFVRPGGEESDHGFRTNTARDGSYTIEGLALGQYTVRAGAPGRVTQFYGGAYDWGFATEVAVTPPENTPNINFNLGRGGAISGFVYESDGITPIQGVHVVAGAYQLPNDCFEGYTDTLADGSYTIVDLLSWDYCIRVMKPGFAPEWYDSKYVSAAADRVTVTEGSVAPDINFTLDAGGAVTGHVYEEDGVTPISGVDLAVWLSTGEFVKFFPWTEYDGSYIFWLRTGSYVIGTNTGGIGRKYVGEWYDGHYDTKNAAPVQVVAPHDTSGIDFYLAKAGSISGHVYEEDGVTPIAGASAYAFPITGDHPGAGANAGPDGSYTIQGLPSGTYRVQATVSGHESQFYHSAADEASATAVTVNAPNDTPAIDFALGPVSE